MDSTLYDEIQSHMLGVIVGLMTNYELTPEQVKDRFDYVASLNVRPNETYVEYKNNQNQTQEIEIKQEPEKMKWADFSSDEELLMEASSEDSDESSDSGLSQESDDLKVYVKTRREFCTAMSSGIKICPNYSNCKKNECKNFHIKQKYICDHHTRGSYCDNSDCDLIVIRPCRKGKRCHDPECSFRHK